MTTSQPPSTNSNKRRPTRSRWIRVGIALGVILVIILIALSTTRTNQTAIDNLVRQANAKQGSEREKTLKALAVTTGNNDVVQIALADYYSSINQPKPAADAFAAGSNKLTDEAMAAYITAGEYTTAKQLFKALSAKEQGSDAVTQAAIAEYNLDNIEAGCKYADQAKSSGAQEACQFLRHADPSRTDAYRLAELHVYAKAKSIIEAEKQKTTGDYLLLIGIASQQGNADQAGDLYVAALKQFPADRQLAEQGSTFCEQSRGVKACTTVNSLANTTLKQTQFAN